MCAQLALFCALMSEQQRCQPTGGWGGEGAGWEKASIPTYLRFIDFGLWGAGVALLTYRLRLLQWAFSRSVGADGCIASQHSTTQALI
ncbi:uncharacterized protein K452DRAFT_150324 [Aplosporella prunicola CBS 121167]|uniref:Uncharacterized protein n=1 Tax=Aplosporella prunicola CBS 121167 TaxID=1176127 RepID=A0A6A6AXQ5_9PEZI|nr:uncharacterized protein K452DRAFT_150324 [Aplosporella prunicola CBS 121167]KAF2135943.1 hypothetical protein K452DRAFT_150324 [Aplosporella prunicola CBS 121167]